MSKSILVRKNNRRGRPKREDGVDPMISTRFPKEIVGAIETWALKGELGRSEAIRRLVELGLTVKTKPTRPLAASADRAKDLAAKVIDSLTPAATDAEEKASRKRRLLKGPEEFREVRVDRAKAKK